MESYRYVQQYKINNNKQKYLEQTQKIIKLQDTKLQQMHRCPSIVQHF